MYANNLEHSHDCTNFRQNCITLITEKTQNCKSMLCKKCIFIWPSDNIMWINALILNNSLNERIWNKNKIMKFIQFH